MAVVKGVVVDDRQQPVPEARVAFVSAPGPVPDVAALTPADGAFALTAPVPGSYVIGAFSDEGASGQVTVVVEAEDVENLVITLKRSP